MAGARKQLLISISSLPLLSLLLLLVLLPPAAHGQACTPGDPNDALHTCPVGCAECETENVGIDCKSDCQDKKLGCGSLSRQVEWNEGLAWRTHYCVNFAYESRYLCRKTFTRRTSKCKSGKESCIAGYFKKHETDDFCTECNCGPHGNCKSDGSCECTAGYSGRACRQCAAGSFVSTALSPGLSAQYWELGNSDPEITSCRLQHRTDEPTEPKKGVMFITKLKRGLLQQDLWDSVKPNKILIRDERFHVRLHGLLWIKQRGTYTFKMKSDDGSALRIDGVRIIDLDGCHGTENKANKVEGGAGGWGGKCACPNGETYTVGDGNYCATLYCANGRRGECYRKDFNEWKHWVRAETLIYPNEKEPKKVNNQKVTCYWPGTNNNGVVELEAGFHPIEIEMFQNAGGKELDVCFEGPGIGTDSCQGSKGLDGHVFLADAQGGGGDLECKKCPRGKYSDGQDDDVQRTCKACGPNTYQDQTGQSSCKPWTGCAAGHFKTKEGSETNNTLCGLCAAGQYQDQSETMLAGCIACEKGKFQNELGKSKCADCSRGKWSDQIGLADEERCHPCPHGTAGASKGATLLEDCKDCAMGYYQFDRGQPHCDKCVNGTFNFETPRVACYGCPPGFTRWAERPGQLLCIADSGSGEFVCPEGHYKPNKTAECEPGCLPGESGDPPRPPHCNLCVAGKYTDQFAQKTCRNCSAGTYGIIGSKQHPATQCYACPLGLIQPKTGQSNCMLEVSPCPAGTYGNPQSSHCEDCTAGWYQNELRQRSCKICGVGRFSGSGASACSSCRVGRFNGQATSDKCVNCGKGSYQDQTGQQTCRLCSGGNFQSQLGQNNCTRCPSFISAVPGADHCRCERGYFWTESDDGVGSCTTVTPPSAVYISESSSRILRTADIKPGFWRRGPNERKVLPCPVTEACIGGQGNGSNPLQYCEKGSEGPLCAVCSNNYFRWLTSEPCTLCPEDRFTAQLRSAGALTGVALILLTCMLLNRKANSSVLRPIINGFQIMVVIFLYPVKWPESVRQLAAVIGLFSFDLASIASPSCFGVPLNFYWRFAVISMFSLGALAVPWLLSWIWHCSRRKPWNSRARSGPWRDTFLLLLLLHPTISGQAFYHFHCSPFINKTKEADSGNWVDRTRYLQIDFSLECYDETWNIMLLPVTIVIIFVAFGMPLLFALTLFKRRATLEEPQTKRLLGFLYYPYRPSMYAFESVVMLFKLSLWATLVFFEHGSQFQQALSAIICFIRLSVHARLEPFDSRFENILEYEILGITAFLSSSGLVLNFLATAKELATLQDDAESETDMIERIRIFEDFVAVVLWSSLAMVIATCLLAGIRYLAEKNVCARFGLRRLNHCCLGFFRFLDSIALWMSRVRRLLLGEPPRKQTEADTNNSGDSRRSTNPGRYRLSLRSSSPDPDHFEGDDGTTTGMPDYVKANADQLPRAKAALQSSKAAKRRQRFKEQTHGAFEASVKAISRRNMQFDHLHVEFDGSGGGEEDGGDEEEGPSSHESGKSYENDEGWSYHNDPRTGLRYRHHPTSGKTEWIETPYGGGEGDGRGGSSGVEMTEVGGGAGGGGGGGGRGECEMHVNPMGTRDVL